MKEPVRLFRRSLMEDETQRYGLSLTEFLGATKLSRNIEVAITSAIQAIDINCQLLLTGFVEGDAFIFQVDNEGVKKIETFAAIGSGAYLAQAALNQRGYSPKLSIEDAIYLVYEAKRASERADGISADTVMFKQQTRGEEVSEHVSIYGQFVTAKGIAHLAMLHTRFGLQPLETAQLPQGFYGAPRLK